MRGSFPEVALLLGSVLAEGWWRGDALHPKLLSGTLAPRKWKQTQGREMKILELP